MAASEDPSHFTVHVFLRHDPLIARSLLPDLFLDFPDSVWKLTPLLDLPPRPREKPKPGYWRWEKPRDVLGRHVFDESLAGNTTLLQLTEKVEQEFAIPKKYQGQFTIVPQDYDEEGQYPRWHNRPLPWNTTLAEVYQVDLDAPKPSSDGFMTETTMMYAPVLHLVLETKAEALRRIVGAGFLEEEIGEPYRLFRDMWNRFDSFWHSQSGAGQEYSELESKLSVWREAHFASAYLAKQREKGRLGPDNDELRAGFRRVDELREQAKQDDLSSETGWALNAEMRSRTPRIRQIEKNEANRQEQLREISRFVTQWEDWILNRDFQNFAIRLLETDKVESKVASVFRKARQVIDEWKLSEGSQRLRVSIEEEYYDARPWLTQESRAQSERSRLEELECATRLPTTLVSGDAATSMNNPLIPSPQIHAHSMRRSDGKLHLDQSTFTVSSGSLLWGQIICLYSAMSHPNFTQNADHIAPELEGGTILQHRFSYRSAARNGPWKVRQYSERARVGRYVANPDGPDRHVGWILYHQDVNPRNTLERVRALDGTGPGAVSNRNLHTDKVRRLSLPFVSYIYLRSINLMAYRTYCILDVTTGPIISMRT